MEIALGLQCLPVQRAWNASVKGTCVDLVAFSYFTNITNLITDIWVFLLPLPIIFRLHVTRQRKFELAGVFAIGLLYVTYPPPLIWGCCADLRSACGVTLARLTVVVSQGSSDFTCRRKFP